MNRRKLSLLLVIVLLITSVGMNVLLFVVARDYYYDLQRVRFNPIGLESFWGEEHGPTDEARIVFYGDSRAAQWPSPQMEGLEFVNRGIGSQTSNQILLRYDEHVAPLEPDILVVQMCINELKTVAIFPTRREQIIESCEHNVRQIIEQAQASGATVILTTVFPVGEVPLRRRLVWSEDVAVAVDEINRFLRQQSAENVILLDTFELLADDSGRVDHRYEYDLLHLNSAGYEVLNSHLIEVLESIQIN